MSLEPSNINVSVTTDTILSVCKDVSSNIKNIDKINILPLLHSIMEVVETSKDVASMKGPQKKQLALDCLHWFVANKCSLSEVEKAELTILIDQVAPPAIDVIIFVANGASSLVNKYIPACCRVS
jgi:hypothetical protein